MGSKVKLLLILLTLFICGYLLTRYHRAYYYSIPFNSQLVTLQRSGIPPNSYDSFIWGYPTIQVNSKSERSLITEMFSREDLAFKLPHDSINDVVYILEPGGYLEMRIISEEDLQKRIRAFDPKPIQDGNVTTIKKCSLLREQIGKIDAKGISCTTTRSETLFDETTQKSSLYSESSSYTDCYLPLHTNRYLAIELKMKPLGDAANMCKVLNDMKIISIY